jgi:DNA-binding NarL/FixJ family response regulator
MMAHRHACPHTSPRRILKVGDATVARLKLGFYLDHLEFGDYHLTEVMSVTQAVDHVMAGTVDLLIIDDGRSKTCSRELVLALQERGILEDLPTILLATQEDPEMRAIMRTCGVAVVFQPVEVDTLAKALAQVLAGRRYHSSGVECPIQPEGRGVWNSLRNQ